MSKYCGACESKTKLKTTDPATHAAWEAKHFGSGECRANFTGTSGMMEVHAAKVLWLRSVSNYKLRYTTMLSDGDTKAYTELCKIQPYGKDIVITKEECINHVSKRLGTAFNHVSKRLGTALRNVLSDASKRKITLGGRGHGRLTANAIRKMSIYYDRAVRRSEKAPDMEKAIMASLYHCFSTDNKPQHQFCPPGLDSWCFYNSTLAQGNSPGPHSTLVHTPLDEELLKSHLLPVYKRLSSKDLLQRCELKGTQNANESLHSVIWSRCRKDHFYSKPRVEFALLLGISDFNFGPKFTLNVRSKIYGLDSWCFYNSTLAQGNSPGPHSTLVHTPLDEELLKSHLLPVYKRLSSKDLLQRCELKGTQNANESLHSVIWSRCRKDHFYSKPRVEFALLLGISDFNFGPKFTLNVRSKIYGLETSASAHRLSRKRVAKRLYNSQRAQTDKATLRRQKIREAKKRKQEELEQLEGGPAYKAGQF